MHKPFSPRLNEFISNWFFKNTSYFKFYEEPQFQLDNSKETFESFTREWNSNKTIPMWNDGSDNNVFGNAQVNAMFRAWHDYMHVTTGNDFTLQGEIETYKIQVEMLPKDWVYERMILQAEIVGQGIHYTFSDKTILDQRAFSRNYIKTLTNP